MLIYFLLEILKISSVLSTQLGCILEAIDRKTLENLSIKYNKYIYSLINVTNDCSNSTDNQSIINFLVSYVPRYIYDKVSLRILSLWSIFKPINFKEKRPLKHSLIYLNAIHSFGWYLTKCRKTDFNFLNVFFRFLLTFGLGVGFGVSCNRFLLYSLIFSIWNLLWFFSSALF